MDTRLHSPSTLFLHLSGARAHHFFIITVTLDHHQPMMITDSKGKLLHVSKCVADDLGYPVQELLGAMSGNIWDTILPEPMYQLHHEHVKVRAQRRGRVGNAEGGLHHAEG